MLQLLETRSMTDGMRVQPLPLSLKDLQDDCSAFAALVKDARAEVKREKLKQEQAAEAAGAPPVRKRRAKKA